MSKTYFLFGVHLHQPVGNFPHVFKKAFDECYLPFFNILKEFPQVKCNVHISGPLYDWILENEKDFLNLLRDLASRGQIELISGAYFEPILSIIPDEDKFSQIKLMNDFIYKNFGRKPKGIWIAERIWQPHLTKIINLSGLSYTFLDDTHFRYAGLMNKEFFGYYTSEEDLKSVFIFPVSKTLRYKIPFSLPEEAISLLESFSSNKDILVTLFDDGEKFGLWPHTFDWVYKKGWLKNFFSLLTRSDKIITVKAEEAIEKFSSQGLIYLPCASYEEMGEWVLEPSAFFVYEELKNRLKNKPEFFNFLRGGFFKNFYTKYPRLNYLHKRMLYLSQKINKYGDKKKDRKMFTSLWKAQCNCGYWHGIFGGFYLSHIRGAIYENLIKAEKELDKKIGKEILKEEVDLDLDGYKEIIFKNNHLSCVFSPRGGAILELSYKNKAFNFLNTITRREESYHKNIKEKIKKDLKDVATIHKIIQAKEENLDRYLIYDCYEKTALIDHLVSKDITLEKFKKAEGFESLANKEYSYAIFKKKKGVDLLFKLKNKKLNFSKRIAFFKEAQILAEYAFSSFDFKRYNFGIEFNLFFLSPSDIKIEEKDFALKDFVLKEKESLEIKDNLKKIIIDFDFNEKIDIFLFPIYSISSSESGFERVFQEICILFILKEKSERFLLSFQIKDF